MVGERVRKFGESLKAPFHRNHSRSPSGSPTPTPSTACTSTPAKTPDTTLPAIAVPLKDEVFQKVVQEYLDNLPKDDKKAFRSATDVIEKLGELQQGKSRISSSHTARTQKVQKVLECVKQFLGSVAICIRHHPEVSSLVVGGLNCILTVSFYFSIFIITTINLFLSDSLHWGILSFLRALPTWWIA